MKSLRIQSTIESPVEEVWKVLSDFGGVHKWAPSVTNSYNLTDDNGGPDAARHCDVAGFGGIQEYVTDWREGSGFTFRVTGVGPIREANSTWTAEGKDGKTVLTTDLEYKTRFGILGSAINVMMLRRKLRQGLTLTHAGLQHHLRTGETVGVDFRIGAAA